MRHQKKRFFSVQGRVCMRALVGGVGAGCGYLVAGFFAWEVGALVKRRGFYAVPGRWVLTWGRWPADQGGTMAAVIRAGIPSAASGPGAAIV